MEGVDIGAEELARKEQWIQRVTDSIVETRVLKVGKMNPELALAGVRWASLWLDDFIISMEETPPSSRDDVINKIETSKNKSWGQSETEYRYPDIYGGSGSPSLQVTIAAHDAFCLGSREPEIVSELLKWDISPYTHERLSHLN